jgi:hypothetical protein
MRLKLSPVGVAVGFIAMDGTAAAGEVEGMAAAGVTGAGAVAALLRLA